MEFGIVGYCWKEHGVRAFARLSLHLSDWVLSELLCLELMCAL